MSNCILIFPLGIIISKKKEELENVLDQFNIQVDNPVVIMSQDTARNFLPSIGGHEKYKVRFNHCSTGL